MNNILDHPAISGRYLFPQNRFSDWKEYDGTKYPSKCAMFRRNSGEPWFFHEIVSIERLKELPEGLKR